MIAANKFTDETVGTDSLFFLRVSEVVEKMRGEKAGWMAPVPDDLTTDPEPKTGSATD